MRKARAALVLGAVAATMMLPTTPAAAGVGNCTSMYVAGLDDPGNATRLGYHTLSIHCYANDVDTCLARGGSPVDLAACLID